MSKLVQFKIRNDFSLGVAWIWVKASFAIFREKPINFMYFGLMYVAMSFLPFLGVFLATAVAMRILMSCAYITNGKNIDIKLSLPMLLRQRNVLSFAIFNTGIDLILVSIVSELLQSKAGMATPDNLSLMLTPQVAYMLIGLSVVKALFYGISPAIILFNPELGIFPALRLSWAFIVRNISVIFFAVVLLAALLIIPLYLFTMLALIVSNSILFGIFFGLMIIVALVSIVISNIFIYNLYATGVERF